MADLSQGLRDDEFFRALTLEPSPDFDNLLGRASRFINLEEARQQKIEESYQALGVSAKAYHKYPAISFGPEDAVDLDDFHCDHLLITINVGGYDVVRAFVDSGSSVDVISYDCFRQMELDLPIFPVTTPIFGFTGGSLTPVGQVKIPVTIGTPPRTRTQTVNFVIVEGSPTSYNIVIGRPMMHIFQAVPSTIHQKLKFPVDGAIGEVKGDQAQSRSCYVEMVKMAEKGRRNTFIKEDLGDEKRPRVDPEDKVAHVQPMDELMTIDLIPGTTKKTRISKVLVQKTNGQWRMCIDFRDLNKACPKDDYPLPRLDQLVDATAGCELLSMMDASQGYHQIPLDKRDQPAVSFITATGTTVT
ncbi:PREDICTED: uncharacterized protein LOC105962655 [Erythranthe guttata]|uniref:uncharacterized protein LOC105962655 n=1 Tax=Erythranthe guttata TaxID=4155 RepID=UPI00064DED5D|nr:PREDICTED: uncharacterized protein LOC105962655 [Erythranthe guttata]|eukprot:XP_012842421.1 PREDICTED: uncharacterized protein LOC105962655 [Erythranthe guttata]